MRNVQILWVIAGYNQNIERTVSDLNRQYADSNWAFIGRDYPSKPERRAGYVRELGKTITQFIFQSPTATGFCRTLDQPCSLDLTQGHRSHKVCQKAGSDLACTRERPVSVAAIVAPWLMDEFFAHFPRAFLIFSDSNLQPTTEDVGRFCEAQLGAVQAARHFMSNLSLSMNAPNLPYRNFQIPSDEPVSRTVADNPGDLAGIMQAFHDRIYDGALQNPRRKIRGGYILAEDLFFQRDRLHSEARVGAESREDVFHLLNTHHAYGSPVNPGMHFDVMRESAGALHKTFADVVTDDATDSSATHVNITPCDRTWE